MTNLSFSDLPPESSSLTKHAKMPAYTNLRQHLVQLCLALYLVSLAAFFAFRSSVWVLLIIGITIVSFFVWIKYVGAMHEKFKQSFENFLSTNSLSPGSGPTGEQPGRPFVFGLGHHNTNDYSFNGKIGSTAFDMYAYTYYKETRNSERAFPFTILHFKLSKPLPHLVLDSHKNDGIISSIPRFFNDSQRIELEGDFNRYFDLFAPKDYQIEALDILSPDFMDMLTNFHVDFDIEINKHDVYIISRGINYDQQSMQELFKAAEVLISKFEFKLKDWSMSAMAKALPELDSYVDESAIRIGGRRISTSVFTIPLISLCAVLYVFAEVSEIGSVSVWMLLAVFMVSMIILVVQRKFRKTKG